MRVKSGKELRIRGEGYYYEGEFFWDYWHFKGGLEGDLTVSYGNHGDYSATGFDGKLQDAIIKGSETQPTPSTGRKSELSPQERKQKCFDNLFKIRLPMAPDPNQR